MKEELGQLFPRIPDVHEHVRKLDEGSWRNLNGPLHGPTSVGIGIGRHQPLILQQRLHAMLRTCQREAVRFLELASAVDEVLLLRTARFNELLHDELDERQLVLVVMKSERVLGDVVRILVDDGVVLLGLLVCTHRHSDGRNFQPKRRGELRVDLAEAFLHVAAGSLHVILELFIKRLGLRLRHDVRGHEALQHQLLSVR
mmetsp:Transcript_24727/g.68846  ORF Transcript_24727/g.68846 Transcript_24727/m.68846 type:complete len:200 (-) Transcript_24727:200-799(-)